MQRVISILRNKAVIYILLGLFCIFLACLCADYDYDLYARLIVGERVFSGLGIAYEDFVSYTPTHLWYDHEWGSGVVFYIFLKYLGSFGLVFLQAITMFFTAFFIIKTQQLNKHAYPISIAFMAIFLILFRHQNPSIVRCHMFTFMFFAMFLYFLEKTRKTASKSNILWLVPIITIIWNNLHGGIVAGLGIIFIYMLGEFISRKPWKKYLFVLLVSTPLLIINPYGVDYLWFLLSANTKARTFITEWWGVFAYRHVRYYYPLMVTSLFGGLLAGVNCIKKKKIDITRLMILVVTIYLGLVHVKLLSLPLIVIASLYYSEIMSLLRKNFIKFMELAAYIFIIVAIIMIPFMNPAEVKVDIKKFPVYETEFLKINKIKGNIVTVFALGSYISYKLYPNNLIFMDGRYEEVYNDREFDVLSHYELADPNWDDIIKYYPSEILMPEKTVNVYAILEKSNDWVKIFEGPVCGIFVKKKNAKKDYLLPVRNLKYYQDNHFDSNGKFGSKEING